MCPTNGFPKEGRHRDPQYSVPQAPAYTRMLGRREVHVRCVYGVSTGECPSDPEVYGNGRLSSWVFRLGKGPGRPTQRCHPSRPAAGAEHGSGRSRRARGPSQYDLHCAWFSWNAWCCRCCIQPARNGRTWQAALAAEQLRGCAARRSAIPAAWMGPEVCACKIQRVCK